MSRDIGTLAMIRGIASIPIYTDVFIVGIIISSQRLSYFRLDSHTRMHRRFHSENLPVEIEPTSHSIQICIRSWNGAMYRDRCIQCRHSNLVSTALPLSNSGMHRRFLSLEPQESSYCIQIRMITPSGWALTFTAPWVLWPADCRLIIKRWGGYEG